MKRAMAVAAAVVVFGIGLGLSGWALVDGGRTTSVSTVVAEDRDSDPGDAARTETRSLKAGLPGACAYRAGGVFPDGACTPGTLNPAVTQATIRSTICVRGWTATIRPPVSVTGPEKLASMAQYRVAGPSGYEYDHLVSLELGGAPNDAGNLWPEPHTVAVQGGNYGSFAKDGVENALRAQVCAGALTLAAAQQIVAGNWTLGLRYVSGNKLPALPTPPAPTTTTTTTTATTG